MLVNKRCGFLKDDKFVPEDWWQLKNKGLKFFPEERRWYQPPRALEDVPEPPKAETVEKVNNLKEDVKNSDAQIATSPLSSLPNVAT